MERRQFIDLNLTPEMTMSDIEEDMHDHQPKKMRYDDQTCRVLESFFKECTHPTEMQRRELSQQLGMEVQQIKFWFQNKRNHMKSQNMRQLISQLRRENEELHLQNMKYTEALNNSCCCATCAAKYFGEASASMAPSQRQPPSTTP